MAVREGNDILGVNMCNGTITPIRYMRDPNTPEGMANIKRDAVHYTWWRRNVKGYEVGSFLCEFNDFIGFYRTMLCMRGTSHGPVSVCVCQSQVEVLLKRLKRRITQTTPHDTPGSLVF